MSRARLLIWLALICVLATFLRARYAQKREGIWRDEAQDIALVRTSKDNAEMLHRLRHEGHPPLHYLIERQVQNRWPGSLMALRWMAIVPGVLAVLLLALLAWRHFGPHSALICGLLAATAPFYIHYSTEVRCYALFMLAGVLYGHAFLHFLTRPGWWSAVLWGVATAALAYTHYYAIWVVAAGGVYALLREHSAANYKRIALGAVTTLALLAPWFPSVAVQLSHDLQPWYVPQRTWRLVGIVFLLPLGRWGAVILAWGILRGVFWTRREGADPAQAVAFRGLFWTAVGSSFAAFFGQLTAGPHLDRYLIVATCMLLPIASVYWARMLAGDIRPASKQRRYAVILIVLALLFQYTDKNGWTKKSTGAAAKIAARIEKHGRPGDVIWISPAFFAPSFCYHYEGELPIYAPPYKGPVHWVDWVELPNKEEDPDILAQFVATLDEQLRSGKRVWLVLDGYYPLSRKHAQSSQRTLDNPRLVRQELQNHRRLLRTLYARADDVFLWHAPDTEYRENMTVVLFDPSKKR